jgi:MoxR-like ATPase
VITTRTFIQTADALIANVSGAVVAPADVIQLSVVSLLSGGHLLLNDLPGMGKTLLARTLAYSIEGSFKRIQFTPDLLPTDITGSSIYNQGEGRFDFIPGPVFANVVLADEINRASTRTQSALLEAMAEGQVTVDGHSYPLPDPFWVVATQNEVDGYGTFPLPQAQLDRFIISLTIGYPDPVEQVTILERNRQGDPVVEPVLTTSRIRDMQSQVRDVEVARPIMEYLSSILAATRNHPQITLGASPRSGVQLQIAAQSLAALRGDSFVTPEHVKAVALPVLRHRIVPAPSATLSVEDAISDTIQAVPVPF